MRTRARTIARINEVNPAHRFTPGHDDSRSQYVRLCDRLTASEIAILIGQDARWRLPAGCKTPHLRMVEAMELVKRDGIPVDLGLLEMEAA